MPKKAFFKCFGVFHFPARRKLFRFYLRQLKIEHKERIHLAGLNIKGLFFRMSQCSTLSKPNLSSTFIKQSVG